jgi:hypothetical protein
MLSTYKFRVNDFSNHFTFIFELYCKHKSDSNNLPTDLLDLALSEANNFIDFLHRDIANSNEMLGGSRRTAILKDWYFNSSQSNEIKINESIRSARFELTLIDAP